LGFSSGLSCPDQSIGAGNAQAMFSGVLPLEKSKDTTGISFFFLSSRLWKANPHEHLKPGTNDNAFSNALD
jgi:hypothetical protein